MPKHVIDNVVADCVKSGGTQECHSSLVAWKLLRPKVPVVCFACPGCGCSHLDRDLEQADLCAHRCGRCGQLF